jgi:hypothetical protein
VDWRFILGAGGAIALFFLLGWTENPDQFRLDPLHHMPGINT